MQQATIHQFNEGQKAMPSQNGYVNLWRDINKQEWASDALLYGFFTKLLTMVQHKPYTAKFKGVEVALQPGEFALDYSKVMEMFSLFRDKRHARQVVEKFIRLGQMYKRTISYGKKDLGFVLGFSGWEKWQNAGTPNGTPVGTPKVTDLAAYKDGAGTPVGTPVGTHINNNDLNNKNINAGSEPQPAHSEIRQKAFEHFWKTWSDAKKLIGSKNTAPKQKTYTNNFAKIFTDSYINKIGLDKFKAEVNAMCNLAAMAHHDIADSDNNSKQSDYFNFRGMYPAKFLSNKQWRDAE